MATAFTRMHVMIDWDGDGRYSNPHSVIPLDRIRAMTVRRGLSTASGTVKEGAPMTINLSLTNEDEIYTFNNKDSPLFGKIRAGIDVQVFLEAARRQLPVYYTDGTNTYSDGTRYYTDSISPEGRVRIGEGRIDNFRQVSRANEAPVILIEALGALRRLSAGRVDIRQQSNITAFNAMNSILDDVNWPSGINFRTIDEVNDIVNVVGGNLTPLEAMRDITSGILDRNTGLRNGGIGGNVLDSKTGGVWFQGPNYRKNRQPHMIIEDNIVISRESQAITIAPVSRYNATLLRYVELPGQTSARNYRGRSLTSRQNSDDPNDLSTYYNEFSTSTSFSLPAASQVLNQGPKDWIATDWLAPVLDTSRNRLGNGRPGINAYHILMRDANGNIGHVRSSAASVFSSEIIDSDATDFFDPDYQNVGVRVTASRRPQNSDAIPGTFGNLQFRGPPRSWICYMGSVVSKRNNFAEVERYVRIDPSLSRYGIRDYPQEPDIYGIATDMVPLRATAGIWSRRLENISGASTPAILTLNLAGHLFESQRNRLMTIDSGDAVVLRLNEGLRVSGLYHVDNYEHRIDSNGILFTTVTLTDATSSV